MTVRHVFLAIALTFVAAIAFLGVADALVNGFGIRTVVTVPIVVVLAVGVMGALAQPPRER